MSRHQRQENKNPPGESSVLFQIRCSCSVCSLCFFFSIGVCLITDWFRFCFSTSGLSKRRPKKMKTETKWNEIEWRENVRVLICLFVCLYFCFWFVAWAESETQEHNAKYDCLMNVSSRLSWRCFDIILVLLRRSPRHRHTHSLTDSNRLMANDKRSPSFFLQCLLFT